jgi:periplasmic divalent cation tolerance protein
MPEILLVLTHCPDTATAARITAALLDKRLAACVSEGAPVRSTYRWQGALESAVEIPLQIKCTRERYPLVAQAIRELHPYAVPEVIALPVVAGHGPYLQWVDDETRPVMVA